MVNVAAWAQVDAPSRFKVLPGINQKAIKPIISERTSMTNTFVLLFQLEWPIFAFDIKFFIGKNFPFSCVLLAFVTCILLAEKSVIVHLFSLFLFSLLIQKTQKIFLEVVSSLAFEEWASSQAM